jgi:hypothetical protein
MNQDFQLEALAMVVKQAIACLGEAEKAIASSIEDSKKASSPQKRQAVDQWQKGIIEHVEFLKNAIEKAAVAKHRFDLGESEPSIAHIAHAIGLWQSKLTTICMPSFYAGYKSLVSATKDRGLSNSAAIKVLESHPEWLQLKDAELQRNLKESSLIKNPDHMKAALAACARLRKKLSRAPSKIARQPDPRISLRCESQDGGKTWKTFESTDGGKTWAPRADR